MRTSLRALLALPLLLSPVAAGAGSLKGSLVFPPPTVVADVRPLAHWRVENGMLPIAPPPVGAKAGIVVALGYDQAPGTVTTPVPSADPPPPIAVEVKPAGLEPAVLVGPIGQKVEIKNADKVPRNVHLKNGETFLPKEATPPGGSREVRFSIPGEYTILDSEGPASATVLVVSSPYFTRTDDKGGFSIDAPDGKYLLRAFYRGAWSSALPVEIGKVKEVALRLSADEERAPEPVPAAEAKK